MMHICAQGRGLKIYVISRLSKCVISNDKRYGYVQILLGFSRQLLTTDESVRSGVCTGQMMYNKMAAKRGKNEGKYLH